MEEYEDAFNFFHLMRYGRSRCKTIMTDLYINKEIKKLCSFEDWAQFGFIINLIPKERLNDLVGLLKVGFSLKESYDTLKETFKF